jgi:hypothetical protein
MIFDILKRYRYNLLLIYTYTFFAEFLFIIQPFFLGKMIDGLINHSYINLIYFLLIGCGNIFFFYIRMIYDTKIYTLIYKDLVLNFIEKNEDNTSTRVARIEMTNHIVNFLEYDISYFMSSIMMMVGSLYFIFNQSTMTGFYVLLYFVPLLFIVKIFYSKIAKSTRVYNSLQERKVDIINNNQSDVVNLFFSRERKLKILTSNLQGKNWSLLSLNKLFFIISGLVIFVLCSSNISQGNVISLYTYLERFLISVMSIPIGMEVITRVQDIIKRVKTE